MIRTVYTILLPKVHLFDLACPVQVFYEANEYSEKKFDLCYVSNKSKVESEQHNVFTKVSEMHKVRVRTTDIICVPGVDFLYLKNGQLDEFIESARSFVVDNWKNGCTVISICTGSLVLAKMGLMDRKLCSTHWKCFDYMKSEFPKVKLREKSLYSIDSNIYTSAGMTSGIDMCLTYLERNYNPLLAAHVAREMVINVRREDIADQKNTFLDFDNKFHPIVYEVQQILQNRIHEIVQVRDLAAELNMSERNLNRLFKKHYGQSITTYRNDIKIKEAERLLMYSKKSVKEITDYLGYATEPYFIRVWKKKHNSTPIRFRQKASVTV